jgi:hypothetical protein
MIPFEQQQLLPEEGSYLRREAEKKRPTQELAKPHVCFTITPNKTMVRENNLSSQQLPKNYPKTENIRSMIIRQVLNDLHIYFFLVKQVVA